MNVRERLIEAFKGTVFSRLPEPITRDFGHAQLAIVGILLEYDKQKESDKEERYKHGMNEYQLFNILPKKVKQDWARDKYIRPLLERRYIEEVKPDDDDPSSHRYKITNNGRLFYQKNSRFLLSYVESHEGLAGKT